MSYCNQAPYRFHPLCQAVMTDHADKNFPKLTIAPDKTPVLPTQLTLTNNQFLYWDGQPLAERYDIEVSETADFSGKLLSDTSAVNGYELSKLKLGPLSFVRIRAVNRFGKSAWSSVCQVSRSQAGTALPAPALLSPTYDQRLIPYNNGQQSFSVESVPGATSYEIQLADVDNSSFEYPNSYTFSQPSFSASLSGRGAVLWRVRGIVGNQPGPWSSTGRFFANLSPYRLSLPTAPMPLTFPLMYPRSVYGLLVQASVATDPSFTQIIYEKTSQSDVLVGFLENLLPNTQYYVRVDEVNNGQRPELPIGTLLQAKQSFRTGTTPLPANWSFINNGTHPNLPQSQPISLITTANGLWINFYQDGLFRVNLDSLTSPAIALNRTNTNGKIGSHNLFISNSNSGEIWLTNGMSSNGGQSFVAGKQLGRLVDQSGEVADRIVFKPGNNYYYSFSAKPHLCYGSDAIYTPQGDSLAKIYQAPKNQYIQQKLNRTGTVWMIQSRSSGSELVEFNLLTKTTRTFSSDNTPQLGRNLTALAVDALGNLWVSQTITNNNDSPLIKFNGQTWTSYKPPAIPFTSTLQITNDPFGSLYVISGSTPQAIYRYDGQTWKYLTDVLNTAYFGSMTADGWGNIWLNTTYQIIRYNRCTNVITPKLSASKATLEAGESVTLRAEGCTSAIWSWNNTGETVSDQLLKGTNELIVKPTLNTTYRARCYDDGCSGTEAKLSLAVQSRLSLIKTDRASYCPGDLLTVTLNLSGSSEATNQYSLLIKSGTQTTRYSTVGSGSTFSMLLPSTLQPGSYAIYAESSQPVLRSRDSLLISVVAFPTAELSSAKAGLLPGDSTRVSVALTGKAPWGFTRWDNQVVQANNTPYVATFVAAQQSTAYKLTVQNLSDANCSTGTVKNTLTVQALVLANEPLTAEGVSVYPNPTAGKLLIDIAAPSAITSLHLVDIQGREVKRKTLVTPTHQEEWDISTAPPGTYLLRIGTKDGKTAIWKVVKL